MTTFLRKFLHGFYTQYLKGAGLILFMVCWINSFAQTNYVQNPEFDTSPANYWWVTSGNNAWIGTPALSCQYSSPGYLVFGTNIATGIAVNNANGVAYTDLPSMPSSNIQNVVFRVRYSISTNETLSSAFDHLYISLYTTSNSILTNMFVLSNLNANGGSAGSPANSPTGSPTCGSYQYTAYYQVPSNYWYNNNLRIKFTMDSDGNKPTIFRIDGMEYMVTTAAPPPTTTCSGTTSLSNCSGSFTDGSGSSNYGDNQNCGWLIQPSGASSIALNFSSFDTESCCDYVKVYNGTNNSAALLGSFSGSSLPSSVTSTGGSMYVEFTTDNSITSTGWSANYSCSTVSACSDPYEYNNSSGSAYSMGTSTYWQGNMCLTTSDEDWFYFIYGGNTYYIKARGYSSSSTGLYSLALSISGGNINIETSPYNGSSVDTYLELYDGSLSLLTSDDDAGVGNFSLINYALCNISISSIYDITTCVNANVMLFNPSVYGGATSYQWYQNGLPVSGQTNSYLQFGSAQASNSGNYYLVASNGSCSQPSNTANLNVITSVDATVQIVGATQNGNSILINSQPANNTNTHSWTVQAPNGNIIINNQISTNLTFTPTMNGDYLVSHRAENAGCYTDLPFYLNITPNYSNNSPSYQSSTTKYNGDPVNTATGEYTYAHDIMSVAARNAVLNFKVFFMGQRLDNNELGYGWRHNWQIKMTRITAPSGDLEIRFPNGRVKYFTEFVQTANPRCVKTYLGETDTLIKNTNGTYTLRQPDGTQYVFENSTGNLLSLTDLNNTTFSLTYTAGKLTKITTPGGRYIDLFYTGNALTSVKNQENHIAYFTQNANNDLVKITNVRGGEFDFAYIGNSHYIQTVTDPNNNVFVSNVYTGNKVTSQTLADGSTFTFQYNTPVSNATTVIDQLGHSEVIYYDANWNLIQQKDAMLNSQYWTYNSNRMLQTYQDELGHITTFGIAANGNVTDVWSPTQRHTHSNFTSLNRPDDIMNALNIHTTIVYNSTTGNPTQINLPNTGQINLVYNNDGTVQSITDAMSRSYSYLYNPQGDVATIITPTGNITLQYDLIGRVRFITDQLSHQTEIQYDNWGNILKTISQLGFYEQFTYDGNGNMLTYKDRNGFITTFTYDNMDRVQTIVQPGNRTTTFIYTLTGKIFKIIYPNLAYIENTYNAKDLLIQRKNVLGGISTFTYLANGLPDGITLPNTYHVQMTYNDENEAIMHYDGYIKDSLFHNAVGNVIKHADDKGHFSLYQFDNMNQLVGVNEGGIANVTLGMNLNGELTSVTDPNNHTATTTLQPNTGFPTIATDAANHVFATTFDNAGNMSGGTDARTISNTITRNANDEMTHIAWSNGEFEDFILDNSGSPTTFGNQNGNFVLAKSPTTDEVIGVNGPFSNDNITYTRNNMGLADNITYETGKTVINTFNNAGQNLTVKDWQNHTVTTQIDNMGVPTGKILPNGITEAFVRNTKGEVLSNFWAKANGDTVFYEAFTRSLYGDITARVRSPRLYPHFAAGVQNNTFAANDAQNNAPFTSDNNGNILTFPIDTLNTPATATYDAKNRMITLVYGSTTIQNYYDALNLLIKQVKNGVTRLYIWDIANGLPHIIRETDGNGVTIASYVWADDVLVSRIDASGNTLYYILDYKGNVVALTDANANITDQYAYGTFGENMKHIGNTDQPFTWQGGYGILHQAGNLYYIRQRWHLGSENRFLSQDVFPADVAMSQTLNRYVYGLNDGNKYNDVTGYWSINNVVMSWVNSWKMLFNNIIEINTKTNPPAITVLPDKKTQGAKEKNYSIDNETNKKQNTAVLSYSPKTVGFKVTPYYCVPYVNAVLLYNEFNRLPTGLFTYQNYVDKLSKGSDEDFTTLNIGDVIWYGMGNGNGHVGIIVSQNADGEYIFAQNVTVNKKASFKEGVLDIEKMKGLSAKIYRVSKK